MVISEPIKTQLLDLFETRSQIRNSGDEDLPFTKEDVSVEDEGFNL